MKRNWPPKISFNMFRKIQKVLALHFHPRGVQYDFQDDQGIKPFPLCINNLFVSGVYKLKEPPIHFLLILMNWSSYLKDRYIEMLDIAYSFFLLLSFLCIFQIAKEVSENQIN